MLSKMSMLSVACSLLTLMFSDTLRPLRTQTSRAQQAQYSHCKYSHYWETAFIQLLVKVQPVRVIGTGCYTHCHTALSELQLKAIWSIIRVDGVGGGRKNQNVSFSIDVIS